jgi:Sulfotransferase domain
MIAPLKDAPEAASPNSLEKVIVVGYPKSGNTWITRLTAELLNCPVAGFWQEPHNIEIACEGQNRPSKIKCFKAHHRFDELDLDICYSQIKIIYVVRDPRDIVLSGAHFFKFDKFPRTRKALEKTLLGKAFYRKFFYRIIHQKRFKIEQMIKVILEGDQSISWCHTPWVKHYKSYIDSPALLVRYEDMLASPLQQSARILRYLGQSQDQDMIKRAVERQSFQRKKSEFDQKKEFHKVVFMRSGKSGEWREKLSAAQKERLRQSLMADLKFFAYEV